MIKYGINNESTNDNYYQNLLFNSSDLMNEIFQYLVWGKSFNEDLCECSLVSSHWLYHVWNPNSVYFIEVEELFRCNDISNRTWTRTWQRLYNVKSIHLHFHAKNSKAATSIANNSSMFRKVEKVDLDAYGYKEVDECMSLVIPIMSRCKDRIKYCGIKIDDSHFNSQLQDFEAPSPLRLPKAQYVGIGDVVFYRIWTNECTRLKLDWVHCIGKDWCKFVIENCDCSNVNCLILNGFTFDDNSMDRVILQQFALKFYNLKTLEMKVCFNVDNNVLLFWQLLKPIISKNKTKVKLTVMYLGSR